MTKNIFSSCCVLCLCAGALQAAELANPGFEKGLDEWTAVGQGWRVSDGDDAYEGGLGAVNDVLPEDVDEWRIVHQEAPIESNRMYGASVWLRTVNVSDSESWIEIQFLDWYGQVIEQFQSEHVSADQPFTLMKIEPRRPPAGATSMSIRGVVRVTGENRDSPSFHIFDNFAYLWTW